MMKYSPFLILLAVAVPLTQASAQWLEDVRLTYDDSLSFLSRGNTWSVAVDDNNVHTVWWDNRDGNYEIYYKRSTDGGMTWEADLRLTNNFAISGSSSIAVTGDTVHVVWNDNRTVNWGLYYKRSTDAGVSWSQDTLLTPNGNIGPTTLTVSGATVHAAWSDARDGNDEIYHMRSTDRGSTWSEDLRLTTDANLSEYPSIAALDSIVAITWWDTRDGNAEIYVKRSVDGGISWSGDTRLTSDPGFSSGPSVAQSGSSVHVVWYDDRDGNQEVYYKGSSDGGLSWSADVRLTNNTASQGIPCITASGLNVHVTWNDYRDGNFETYYKVSTDNGATWSDDTRVSFASGTSWSPSLAVSGTTVHLVWIDDRDGNDEIYYAQNPAGNPTGIGDLADAEGPETFELFQNYPNPFNPVTTIRFSVPTTGFVTLNILDALGREIDVLVSRVLAPGSYSTEWDAGRSASGVYFYRMETAGLVRTGKLVLLR